MQGGRSNTVVIAAPTDLYKRRVKLNLAVLEVWGVHITAYGLNISANIVWLDHEYSKERLKPGVHFAEIDDGESSYVGQFIDWIQKKENYFLHCELEKC